MKSNKFQISQLFDINPRKLGVNSSHKISSIYLSTTTTKRHFFHIESKRKKAIWTVNIGLLKLLTFRFLWANIDMSDQNDLRLKLFGFRLSILRSKQMFFSFVYLVKYGKYIFVVVGIIWIIIIQIAIIFQIDFLLTYYFEPFFV